MHPIVAKIWIGITFLMVVIPVGLLLWRIVEFFVKLWAKREVQVQEAKERSEVKEVLEDQQDEFITTNEY